MSETRESAPGEKPDAQVPREAPARPSRRQPAREAGPAISVSAAMRARDVSRP